MSNVSLVLDAAWKVLFVGLLLGAGLPTVFALGVRSLAWGAGGSAEVDAGAPPHPAGRLVAVLCFAVVVAGVALGITFIVASGFGKELDFANVYPTLVDK